MKVEFIENKVNNPTLDYDVSTTLLDNIKNVDYGAF